VTGDPCVQALRVLGHELRRPLTVIRGASTLLVDDLEALPPASRTEMLDLIDRSAAAMDEQIEDLLTAVHLDIGDVDYLLEPVELRAVLEAALEAARRADPARAIDCSGADGLVVEADRDQVVRAVRAVLLNAVRHTPPESPVEVVAAAGPETVWLEVLDRGPGIPEARRELAFEKFGRLDDRTGGAGLGLFLARGLARGMGGDLSLDDREDGGAVACFTLKRRV
jgi:two-component system sensor histidine kinase KdpD